MYSENNSPLTILDIGCGDGRIPILLSKELIWGKIELFVGFDNSRIEIKKFQRATKQKRIKDKVKIVYFNALDLNKKGSNEIFKHKYDLIICTYFTPGNFKPDAIKIFLMPFKALARR